MPTTEIHEEKETLHVDVLIPGHEARTETELFRRTRESLLTRECGRCFICGGTEETTGHPLEAHHHPVERSMANLVDWPRFQRDCLEGVYGPYARLFDWEHFDPADPMRFVDDMRVNGMLLCKAHHTGLDEGIHCLPYPLWIAQRLGAEGYRFSPTETIHHKE